MQQLLVMYLTKDLSLHFATEKCVVTIRDLAIEIMLLICDPGKRNIVLNYILHFHIILHALDCAMGF